MKLRIHGDSLRLRLNRSTSSNSGFQAFARHRSDLTPVLS
jgi:hypothetical protein